MSLRLYDTGTRSVRGFEPLNPPTVTMYLCGDTVYAPPHIGHARSKVVFDVLARWLAFSGHEVVFARNITDIDDKIIMRAAEEQVPWWQVSQRNIHDMRRAYDLLGLAPPTVEPLATAHIPQMIELIQRLVDKGHAYASGGDVYFDVQSLPEYGSLSGQRPDQMVETERTDPERSKRNPLDFALWKSERPGEPAWDTPWGRGRPGWHLECSAMVTTYLGPEFDIHGGGTDIVFPHHENEVAQSHGAGDAFARFWLHNGMLNLGSRKMSKSLGNTLLITELAKRWRPAELRYYLVAPHYRSSVEYAEELLDESAAAYRRIEGYLVRAVELVGDVEPAAEVPQGFREAMDDDLGTPQAMATVHNAVRDGNAALAAGDKDTTVRLVGELRAMLGVLGLDPFASPWVDQGGDDSRLREALGRLVEVTLDQRQQARARKDFATADALRDGLASAGVVVEDTPNGPRWSLGDG
ncbi:MAG: cysteine--tRNA ligase [Streptosporangiales bacterium]|nr:cysteine--tRNA ligase [Streptosporangiales bacterium]